MIEVITNSDTTQEFILLVRPISTNDFWAYNRRTGKKYITNKGRAWRLEIQTFLQHAINRKELTPFSKEDVLKGIYHFNLRTSRLFDTANGEKPLTDTIEGLLIPNDKQIQKWEMDRTYNCNRDSIYICFEVIGNN